MAKRGGELAKLASASSSSTLMPSFMPSTTQPTWPLWEDDWSSSDFWHCDDWNCDEQDRSTSIVYILLALVVVVGFCILLKSLQSEQGVHYTSPPEQDDLELEEGDAQEMQIEMGTIT